MARYPLQGVLDGLPVHFRDAILLDLAVERALTTLTEQRIAERGSGSGAPPAFHASMNRAVVVAAVGGIEAYFESLAETALGLSSVLPQGAESWYTISGSRGDLQTPNPRNIRKLFWSLFHVDLRSSWCFSVTTSEADEGGTGTWRRAHHTVHRDAAAADFLNAMVRVRHSFAHMDRSTVPTAVGMASRLSSNTVSVQSHHAFNAVSAALQVAVQSTLALGAALGLDQGPIPRWKVAWNSIGSTGVGLDYWLLGTPVWNDAILDWTAAPTPNVDEPDAAVEEAAGIPDLTDYPEPSPGSSSS